MTHVVWETPSGGIDPHLVVRFTMDVEPTNISVKFIPETGAGGWDTAYGKTDSTFHNGVVADKYAGRLSRASNSWTLQPPLGGWPCRIQVIVDPSGSSTPVPALLPIDYLGAIAQYVPVLNGTQLTLNGRGNHGHPLTAPSGICGPSAVPGQVAILPYGSSEYGSNVATGSRGDLGFSGAVSLLARVWCPRVNFANCYQCAFTVANRVSASGYTQFYMGVSDSYHPTLAWQDASGNYALAAHTATINDGQWHLIGFSRNASGTDGFVYVDGVAQAFSGLPAPVAGQSQAYPSLGDNTSGGSFSNREIWRGGIDEVDIWGVACSSADFDAARKIMMGL